MIRNKWVFLCAVLDALLLLVTWSSSSTLTMRARPLKSVTVRTSKQWGGTVGWWQETKVSRVICRNGVIVERVLVYGCEKKSTTSRGCTYNSTMNSSCRELDERTDNTHWGMKLESQRTFSLAEDKDSKEVGKICPRPKSVSLKLKDKRVTLCSHKREKNSRIVHFITELP